MNNKTINDIRQLLHLGELTVDEINELRNDKRKGVQQLIKIYDRNKELHRLKKLQHIKLQQFDLSYKHTTDTIIAGVDEAGRGPLAGPVVSAAVILPASFECIGLTDSKQLTENEREKFYEIIVQQAIDYAVAIIHNDMIDRLNILEATKQSMKEALLKLSHRPEIALIDAVTLQVEQINTVAITKGDEKSLSIAAASVIAKVTRDRLMNSLHDEYPQYDFQHNKGYGSKRHLNALKRYGPTPIHRKSFSPVQKVLNN